MNLLDNIDEQLKRSIEILEISNKFKHKKLKHIKLKENQKQ